MYDKCRRVIYFKNPFSYLNKYIYIRQWNLFTCHPNCNNKVPGTKNCPSCPWVYCTIALAAVPPPVFAIVKVCKPWMPLSCVAAAANWMAESEKKET